tara:strand:+ start:83 stop:292 length:210 start_codon:yes stop_codon:yes gene_type:complete
VCRRIYPRNKTKISDGPLVILKFCAAYSKENVRSKASKVNSKITDGVLITLLNKKAIRRKINAILRVLK